MFDKVNLKKLNEQVYAAIKNAIIEDELKPGEKLSVERISKELGVSRTPVSNAMQVLERDGYVIILPQSGTYVRQLSLEEIKAIYELRESIEGMIVKLIINKIDRQQLKQFSKSFDQFLSRYNDVEVIDEYFNLDLAFHEYLISLCPQIIQKDIRNIIDLTKRSRKLNLLYEMKEKEIISIMEKEINNHKDIIKSLLKGD